MPMPEIATHVVTPSTVAPGAASQTGASEIAAVCSPAPKKPIIREDSNSEQAAALSSIRVNWQLKTIWPVAAVLLAGMLLFLLSTLSLRGTERHRVLVIAGA